MAFVSEFLDKPVMDIDGKRIGALDDLIAHYGEDFPHPVVKAIVVSKGKEVLVIPYSDVALLSMKVVALKNPAAHVNTYKPHEQDIYLSRDVLDKQIIDTDGARLVRVNDLELLRVNGTLYISNVDVGGMGILRRIGLGELAREVSSRLKIKTPENYISWDDVELLQHDQSMRLKVPTDKIKELHPADIAEIISDMNRLESGEFLEALDVEDLADTLEEVEPEFQASLVENMPDEKVADVLEEMEPDEAADLLAELPPERSQGLLNLMEEDDAKDVRKLLTYPEESAGGIMTTEYAAVRPYFTAEQAIQFLREQQDEIETMFYVYVTDDDSKLVGVFSLPSLIFADPQAKISDFMVKRLVSVDLLEEQDEVAQKISKYDLVAIPVVDQQEILHGIVTADDALDKMIPTAWKKKLPRFYH